jgi:hypothetical protein
MARAGVTKAAAARNPPSGKPKPSKRRKMVKSGFTRRLTKFAPSRKDLLAIAWEKVAQDLNPMFDQKRIGETAEKFLKRFQNEPYSFGKWAGAQKFDGADIPTAPLQNKKDQAAFMTNAAEWVPRRQLAAEIDRNLRSPSPVPMEFSVVRGVNEAVVLEYETDKKGVVRKIYVGVVCKR